MSGTTGAEMQSFDSAQLKSKRSRSPRRRISKRGSIDEDPNCYDHLAEVFRLVRDHRRFQAGIIAVIVAAGVLVAIQTYPVTSHRSLFAIALIDELVVGIFVAEILIKLIAEGRTPLRFFTDNWNVFDFLIVSVGFLPFDGGAITALRLVRLLRVLKLVRALPELRILVMGLMKSLSSIGYIGLLLLLLFYLYAVLGVTLFGENDPVHMGSLHIAMITLFRCATLEDWTDVMYISMEGCANYGYDDRPEQCTSSQAKPVEAVIYHVSLIWACSYLVLNLFVGVLSSSMDDARTELQAEAEKSREEQDKDEDQVVQDRLRELAELMDKVTEEIEHFAHLEKERAFSTRIAITQKQLLTGKNAHPATGTTSN